MGEWQWRFGLDPRAFADEIMPGASHLLLTSMRCRVSTFQIGDFTGFECLLESFC